MNGPTWHVLGVGAIGSLFAWRLAEAGMRPRLIPRHQGAAQVNLRFQPFASHEFLNSTFATDDGHTPISHLLVTVKAHQTQAALASVQQRLGSGSTLLLLQNGMGTLDIAQRLCPISACLVGSTTEGAHRTQAKSIIHAGVGNTWIGALQPELQPQARSLSQSWQARGLEVQYDPNILQRLWDKLAINCAINPLTVIYNCNNGQLLEIPRALSDMRAICCEVEAVMAGVGVRKPIPGQLFELVKSVAKRTSGNVSSMLQDARAGRATEIHFITGYLVERADTLGIPAEQNKAILAQLG
ncbi:2-dehydropantoate 2-reductase [Ketobacter sp. MCCC 1A13808]|uniref:ketopantoate reductase family protein n=1 Tax=Ketobacter sp. MCCC 1A13808 TaxID=2602738 RepID=UPI0012EB60AD|nr:2-dehydropantoate 2-reductase [Ketobacter sp. MCCC 1A13808]MVF11160.1 2-dehydropantoate 2-reductase [Ketobacter sp. MCCC 1A13808]